MSYVPKFSVIVPVYKAESYIDRCIEGILAQTVTDFELILVNDGSPDRSGEICEKYAKMDKRVKVFHKENGGPSSARNVGLENACAEIISFVDSDDIVDDNFLENFGECHSDITIQSMYVKYPSEEKERYIDINEGKYNKDNLLLFMDELYKSNNTGYLYLRAFKRDIIETNFLRFNVEYRLREDEEFIWRYMCYCKDFEIVNKGSYHYYMPDFSSKYNHVNLESDFECTRSIIDNLYIFSKIFDNSILVNNINRMATIVLNNYRNKGFNLERTKSQINVFCRYYTQVNSSKISLKSKLVYYLICIHNLNIIHKIYRYVLG